MRPRSIIILIAAVAISAACGRSGGSSGRDSHDDDIATPRYLNIFQDDSGRWNVVSISPFGAGNDTLTLERPLDNLIVMSTSHIGFLDAIGRTDVISGVSGKDYIYCEAELVDSERSDSGSLRGTPLCPPGGCRGEEKYPAATIVDVGYDASPDYERIVALKPDLLLTYTVSAAKSPFLTKLEQLGIRVFIVNEHLESHPLARASYIRLFGALTGSMDAADSVLSAVKADYSAIAESVKNSNAPTRKVLLNIPYKDQWFVPSDESYLSAMINDAGGKVLGSEPGRATSSCMSVEKAYSLSGEADYWLNVGWCSGLDQLLSVNPVFGDMLGRIEKNLSKSSSTEDRPSSAVWNDNKRLNPKGGNDIWQSGVARPDLVLRDLVTILHPGLLHDSPTIYYRPVE